MKEDILELIPKEKTELIAALAEAEAKDDLFRVLVIDFGIDRSVWQDWQKEVEAKYLLGSSSSKGAN